MIEELKDRVGYFDFHSDVSLNFQLNRARCNSGCSVQELYEIGSKIDEYKDVTPVLLDYYNKAKAEERVEHALYYLRVAEFFCFTDNKKKLYWNFRELFYQYYSKENLIVHEVPYENGYLPVLELLPEGEIKESIVVHGGGDSFIEEFYPNVKPFVDRGFRVLLFEGPGQGYSFNKHNLYMTHEWEKPTTSIIDYFDLSDITLLGISLGGYFALRAAAFEPRIKKVILWDVVYDFFECVLGRGSKLKYFIINLLTICNAKKIINKIIQRQMKASPEADWIIKHSIIIHNVKSPFDYLKKLKKYSTKKISHLVKADVLVLAGEDDHIIPFRMFKRQLRALKNAKSVTGRAYKREEKASAHGQIGNIGLVTSDVINWLRSEIYNN